MTQTLPPDYRPSKNEPFMNDLQLEYFRKKLSAWRDELLNEFDNTRDSLGSVDRPGVDFVDQASSETEQSFELRNRGRERQLIAQIIEALERIKNQTFGYCAETGNPIGLARLEARPIAALSIEAQERLEERESRGYHG